jgi:PDZ domain-containing protein
MEITTGSTPSESVLADPRRPGRNRATVVLVIVVLFVIAANTFVLPYYAISPGSALDTAPLVVVPSKGNYHPAKGKVLLTTVSLGKVTLFEALQGWLDPAIDVVDEDLIAGPNVNEDELRQQNLAQMDESKQKAVGVAFEKLGVDAIQGDGVEVVTIYDGTPADGKLELGDRIMSIDGTPTKVDSDAVDALSKHVVGDTVTLTVVPQDGKDDDTHAVTLTLVADPKDAKHAIMGVQLTTKVRYSFPFDVEVGSNQIGGPSAGLAFTLEVLDVLTDGELTGGHTVAATGTIELDGSVGEVGGVAQKTIAVKRAGAELFLVPSGEYEAAKRFAGDDLRIEVADSLDQALQILATLGGNGLHLPHLDG